MSPFSRNLLVMMALLLSVGIVLYGCDVIQEHKPANGAASAGGSKSYVFGFWNVENLFDDRDDGRNQPGDKEYDGWLAKNPQILREKLGKLTDGILSTNDGKGPDILGVVEVESVRAAELLQHTLNSRLDPSLHYTSVLMKEVTVGRHIAPAILTRLPVVRDRTRNYGSRYRIVQGTVLVDGRELNVIVSHWTSRLKAANEKGRMEYADKIYGACNAMYHSNPAVDFLVCGDFNDTPADKSVVEHLHAVGDAKITLSGPPLKLFHLQALKDPATYGTHYYQKWFIFDQIAVSPGMLDNQAWSCVPDSVKPLTSLAKPRDRHGRPWRFGGEKETGQRGYSDHFPVTVQLNVH